MGDAYQNRRFVLLCNRADRFAQRLFQQIVDDLDGAAPMRWVGESDVTSSGCAASSASSSRSSASYCASVIVGSSST